MFIALLNCNANIYFANLQKYQNSTGNTNTNNDTMEKLRADLHTFASIRDWRPFHTPKNLAMALSVEVAELTEIFQWMKGEESHDVEDDIRKHIAEEVGDVMIYLTMLAEAFDLDPLICAKEKMKLNQKKYPAPEILE